LARCARARGQGDENVSTLEGAVIGLLALIVGFTFAMALARFEARQDAVLSEANAIGTTALRARLLAVENRQPMLAPAPVRNDALKVPRLITGKP
jgi:hypothetical protein